MVGLDVKRLYALTFGLGAACVGAAGAMLVLIIDVTPPLGPAYTLLAFVIVITGGLGSMPGALLGGVLIGLTEAMAGLLFTPSAKSMFAFAHPGAGAAVPAAGHHGQEARHDRAPDRRRAAPRACCCLALLLAALIAAPLFASDYLLTVLILILYFAYIGQAWNIMMGFAGQLSLGHALYVGLGAYTAAALYVHFGIGPWLGLLVAIPVAVGCGAFIGFLAFRFGVAGVYFAILTIAFAEFARIGFDHFGWVGGSAGLFLPVAQYTHNDLWQPARPAGDVLLRDPGADGRWPSCSAARCCAAASAISGWRSARTRRPRARSASTPSATRCIAVVISAGMTSFAGVFYAFYLQQPVSRAGVPHLCARSRSSSGRSSAASARCSGRSSARSC